MEADTQCVESEEIEEDLNDSKARTAANIL